MCVKSVELTCTRTYTKTHDIKQIIVSLPDMDIKEDLLVAWRENVPDILKNYSEILYKGLNRYTGILRSFIVKYEMVNICYFQGKTQESFSNSIKNKFRKALNRLIEIL